MRGMRREACDTGYAGGVGKLAGSEIHSNSMLKEHSDIGRNMLMRSNE